MPSAGRFRKGGGFISKSVEERGISTPHETLNAIDFIESHRGLGIRLFPIQRLIIKCVFGVPMDYKEKRVPLYDIYRERLQSTVMESEALRIFYEEGRCNVGDWRDIPDRGYNEACILAGRRGGKLLSVDEPIPTPSGFVRNGDLKDGDEVLGEDGKTYKVLVAHPIVEEDAFRVSFDDGTFTYAHAGHLWRTYTQKERKNLSRRMPPREMPFAPPGKCGCGCGKDAPVSSRNELHRGIRKGDILRFIRGHWLHMPRFSPPIQGGIRTTEEVLATLSVKTGKGIQTNHAIPLALPVDLPDANLPLDPYCLGYWLGDGNSDCGILTCSPQDAVEVLPNFSAAGYEWHQNTKIPTRWHVLGLPLGALGVLNNKHIPHTYLWTSSHQRLALLQGLCDSDGHCETDGQVEFCNTNRGLAEGVYQLAASLGMKPFFHKNRARLYGKDCGPKYCVTWTGSLPAFRLKRKLAKLRKSHKSTQHWRYITSIQPVGKMWMRCITTSNPTGLYLFGKNFNITHNSQLVSAMAAYKLYLLLNWRSPQAYFDLVPNSHIDFTFLAQDEEGSDRLYDKLREDVNRAPFFAPFFKVGTGTWMGFITVALTVARGTSPPPSTWTPTPAPPAPCAAPAASCWPWTSSPTSAPRRAAPRTRSTPPPRRLP